MIPAYSSFLAWRYLRTRWVNLLGTLGVAVAVWALIVVIAVFSGFIGQIRSDIRVATPDLLCTGLPPNTTYAPLAALLRADPEVVATAPRLRHYGMYFPYGRNASRIQQTRGVVTPSLALAYDFVELIGIDPAAEFATTGLAAWLAASRDAGYGVVDPTRPLHVPVELEERWRIHAHQTPTPGELLSASPGILLSEDRLTVGRLEPGQQLSVVTGRLQQTGDDTDLLVVRRFFTIAGGFETNHRVLDQTAALVPIDVMREMLGHAADDPFASDTDVVSDVAIRVAAGADPAVVAARLQAALKEPYDATVLTWEEQNRVFLGAVDQERGMMKLILFAVMLVAAFLIYSTLHMTVTQKTKDIGILASLGAAPGGILRIFLLSGAVVGVVGCTIGVVTGIASVYALNPVNRWTRANLGVELFPTRLYSLDAVPYRIDVDWVVQVVLAAITITLLAAWLPARRAARMTPVRALAHE